MMRETSNARLTYTLRPAAGYRRYRAAFWRAFWRTLGGILGALAFVPVVVALLVATGP